METRILPIDATETLPLVATLLDEDRIFVAPTDTVYGLFCRYDAPKALARIYAAKDRPPQKAIPILIGAAEQLDHLVQNPRHPAAEKLIARFWPGPLTLVLPAQPHLPPELTAGAPTVAVRMPNHTPLRHLLRALGPLAATSANRSGQAETHSVEQVLAQLAGRVDLILYDESQAKCAPQTTPQPASQPLASTIVDLARPDTLPRILREGPLGQAVRELLAASDSPSEYPAERPSSPAVAPSDAHRG